MESSSVEEDTDNSAPHVPCNTATALRQRSPVITFRLSEHAGARPRWQGSSHKRNPFSRFTYMPRRSVSMNYQLDCAGWPLNLKLWAIFIVGRERRRKKCHAIFLMMP